MIRIDWCITYGTDFRPWLFDLLLLKIALSIKIKNASLYFYLTDLTKINYSFSSIFNSYYTKKTRKKLYSITFYFYSLLTEKNMLREKSTKLKINKRIS